MSDSPALTVLDRVRFPEAAARVRQSASREELLAALDNWRAWGKPERQTLLRAVADKADVDFVSISPGQPTSAGSYSVVPVQLNVVGGFFAVDQYMYLLETLPRVSKVTTMSISGGPDGLPQLTITLTANFYTTDTSAGPGSIPGGEQPAAAPVAPQPSPGG